MARRKQTIGICEYCKQELAKSGISRHFVSCQKRKEIIAKNEKSKASTENIYHLRIQDAWAGNFWFDVEIRGSATLEDLDYYLRTIWLECCGHLSQFSIGGWRGDEIDMDKKVDEVFQEGLELTHIYDFGTTSETIIKVKGVRKGKLNTKHPIELMARNILPESTCEECDQQAVWFCQECMIEENKSGLLCDGHATIHPHDNYGEPIQIANSPRLGMCGYDGPAEPPY